MLRNNCRDSICRKVPQDTDGKHAGVLRISACFPASEAHQVHPLCKKALQVLFKALMLLPDKLRIFREKAAGSLGGLP